MGENWHGAPPVSMELRLILVGTIDCGKTLTADTLLGQTSSPPAPSFRSCHLRQGLSHSCRLTLVEAPRWYWSGDHLESSVHEETKAALTLASPGPHGFLLLIPVNQFTEMERRAPQQIEKVFGRGALQHTLVLLTCGDYLIGHPVEEYLAKENHGLREVIELCEGRYHIINNRKPEDRQQVIQLLKKVEHMVQEKGGFYIQAVPLPRTLSPTLMEKQVVVDMAQRVNTMLPWSTSTPVAEHGERMGMEKPKAERRENERAERERLEKEREERMVKERLERERLERERLEKKRDAEWLKIHQAETERNEKERIEREQLLRKEIETEEKERAKSERIMREREEKKRTEQKRLEIENRENESMNREKMEKEKLQRKTAEKERLKQEKEEQDRTETLRRKKEKAEKGMPEQERMEKKMREKERVEKLRESSKQERLEKERLERETMERKGAVRDRADEEMKEGIERLEKERTEIERRKKDRGEREKFEKEQERLNTEREDMKSRETEKKKLMKEEKAFAKHSVIGHHAQTLPQKQEPIEQQCVSEDKHKMTKGTSQPAAEGAVLNKLSETADKGELIYRWIVTIGEDPSPASELRLVLLGCTKSGKSAAGNAILGRKEFQSQADMAAVTQQCEKGRTVLGNRQVAVVDTPDWFASERSPAEVHSQLSSCVALSSPGPHAFLLCVPLHRPPDATQMQVLDALEGVFGPGMVSRHTLLLFTHSDMLRDGRGEDRWGTAEVEEYITSKLPDLLKLVERCGDRYHILERGEGHENVGVEKKEGEEDEKETERGRRSVEELLEKVEQMVRESGGSHYSCHFYQEVESRVRERQEEILQARRERRMERRRRREGVGGQEHVAPSGHLVSLKEDLEGEEEEDEEDEVMEIERAREQAEKSVTLDSVPALPLKTSPTQHFSLLRSVGEKAWAGMRRVPKLLAGGALVGGGLGSFLGGPLAGAVGATAGAALAEVGRRKLSKQTHSKGQKKEKKDS